jgi:hypothetical protein
MEYSVYEYNKETDKYKFTNCMTLEQLRKNGISEEKRVKVGSRNIQKYIIK